MSEETKPSDKEVLRKTMSEPTFEAVAKAARRENKRREQEIVDALRAATPQPETGARTKPTCAYCDETEGLRQSNDGGGYETPDFICEGCFTPTDTGPCFDDLPEAAPTL